jgi:glycosyl transferase, family 25
MPAGRPDKKTLLPGSTLLHQWRRQYCLQVRANKALGASRLLPYALVSVVSLPLHITGHGALPTASTMRIDLINLDRSPERLQRFHESNAHILDVERLPAVDGRTVAREFLQEHGVIDGAMSDYTNGAMGTALSHMLLWERAITEDRVVTACEDDTIFHFEFEKRARDVLARLPQEWDLILWGWNFDAHMMFDMLVGLGPCLAEFNQKRLRDGLEEYRKTPVDARAFKLLRAFGIMCYSVSPAGARKLKSFCLPIRPMDVFFYGIDKKLPNNGLDIMMNAIYPDIQAYVSFPPLVASPNDKDASTVQVLA